MVQDNPPPDLKELLKELQKTDIYLKDLPEYHRELERLHKTDLQFSFFNAKSKGWDMRQWESHCLSDLKLKRDQTVYLYQKTAKEWDRVPNAVAEK